MIRFALFAALSLNLGCAMVAEDETATSTAKLQVPSVVGAWRAGAPSIGAYEALTFSADGTYHATAVSECLSADCVSHDVVEIDGEWSQRGERITMRATRFPPDHRSGYITTHELGNAALNFVDEYVEAGLETQRFPVLGGGGLPERVRLDGVGVGCPNCDLR